MPHTLPLHMFIDLTAKQSVEKWRFFEKDYFTWPALIYGVDRDELCNRVLERVHYILKVAENLNSVFMDCWQCIHLEKRAGSFQYCLLYGARRNVDANKARCDDYQMQPLTTQNAEVSNPSVVGIN